MALSNRLIVFLISSFLSAVGDSLLLFAVPVGLGLETGHLRYSVMMWFIPAIAIFISSFLHNHVARNRSSARTNYALIVLSVAALEIIISLLAMRPSMQSHIGPLLCVFVFGYAFIKEGIPRLLYVVSVYRYFGEPQDYQKIAGLNHGLNILAGIAGSLFAALLVASGSWKLALLLDAVTFLIFGLVLKFFGTDPVEPVAMEIEKTVEPTSSIPSLIAQPSTIFFSILFGTMLLPIANSLVGNHLPLLAEKFSLASASAGIMLIALLRLPGILGGLVISKITRYVSQHSIIKFVPILNAAFSLLFVVFPHLVTFCLLIVAQGIVAGLYWPTDYSVRNNLNHADLVKFNMIALRRLAVAQFVTCCAALFIFETGLDISKWIPVFIFGLSAAALLSMNVQVKKIFRAVQVAFVPMLLVVIILVGVRFRSLFALPSKPTIVLLPSVSHDFTLRGDLTFSSFAILNDVGAHFVKISKDLSLEPEVLLKFERLEGGKEYLLHFDKNYRSARGERISVEDIQFTIRHFLSILRPVAGVLHSIAGADRCKPQVCQLEGVKILSPETIRVTLQEKDVRFVEKLSSPWLLIFKKDRPLKEKTGNCILPYQLGKGLVTDCQNGRVKMKIGSNNIEVAKVSDSFGGHEVYRIINDNPGLPANPTLTVMAVFANPLSSLPKDIRKEIVTRLRVRAPKISESLSLRWSPLLVPQWLSIQTPSDLQVLEVRSNFECPGRPIRILLDTSLPNLQKMKELIAASVPCKLEFAVTEADKYFVNFSKSDLGVAWFSPDYLDLYNEFSAFDCSKKGACYFNWNDPTLQKSIDQLRQMSQLGVADEKAAIDVERILFRNGYMAPLSEMNWWIQTPDGYRPIHPAGLGQLSISEFL